MQLFIGTSIVLACAALAVFADDPPKTAENPKTTTPQGCRQLTTDTTYPSAEAWKSELPKAELRNVELEGDGHTDYKITAATYQDVIDAVKFAGKHNLRLTMINSGHDFLGRNDAPSGLGIDLSQLGGINVLQEFIPTEKGAEAPKAKFNVVQPKTGKQAAVTIGAGISTQVLNDALDKSKLVSVGAAHGNVATAGGFGQMGGHSPISDLFGLGIDQMLEYKVVTADGTLRVANKVSNPDLFWALRGGGGSTFGVVVEATLKAHPTVPITLVQWNLNNTGGVQSNGIWEAYAELHRQFPNLVDNNGVSAYYYHYGSRLSASCLHKGKYAGKDKAEKIWDPLLKKLESFPNVKRTNYSVTEYASFKEYFDARFGAIDKPGSKAEKPPWEQSRRFVTSEHVGPLILEKRHEPEELGQPPAPRPLTNLDSRLLGIEHFKSPNLTAALQAALPQGIQQPAVIQGHLVAGGKVHKPDDPDTAVLPAWRKAYVHLISWRVPGKTGVDSLIALAPDMGAYGNEAWPLQQNWKTTFWGSNYPKLSQIKTKYDPTGLFWATPGINADLFEARSGRQCKRSTLYTASEAPMSDNPNRGLTVGG